MKSFVRFLAVALLTIPLVSTQDVAAQSVDGPAGSTAYVTVSQNRELSGAVAELTELDVSTSFGEVKVPVAKIDGIKMNVSGDGAAVIAFANGDMLTGKVQLDTIKLNTEWGTAHINANKIETITFDKNGRFFADNTSGSSGWRFTKSQPIMSSSGGSSNLMTTPRN